MTQSPLNPDAIDSPLHFGGEAKRPLLPAMLKGFGKRCPACGEGRVFGGYLKVNDTCPACGEDLHHQRADDAPPYFTIFIVGHILIPIIGVVEKYFKPDVTLQVILWPALAVILCLWFLPRVKGALIGLQWANRMHGFGGEKDEMEELAESHPSPQAD